ncbi:MAG: TIGR03915 family putative DNA repair protein [Firmicutes bacterium]|nr:TIGR03915 family putative DNA repair protein [Bacillota bacterium]
MIDYIYDGTFEGFLTCVHHHYYNEKAAGIYPADQYQTSLLKPYLSVETDEEKVAVVYAAMESKISEQALERIYRVFLSDFPGKDNIALDYLRLGFKIGGRIFGLHSHPVVFAAERIARKVGYEAHRLTGLLRFSVLAREDEEGRRQEILFAKIKPDHDILELLAHHFTDRFKEEAFIIYDERRKKALFAFGKKWYIGGLDPSVLPEADPDERAYRKLWKTYFDGIAIKERINPRCQKNFMPVRYWDNLTEFHCEADGNRVE